MTRYSEHTIAVSVQSDAGTAVLGVKAASVTMDDSWAPFIQGDLTCSLPDAATIALVDPRTDARLTVTLYERVGVGGTLADFDTDWGAGTLGTLFASGTLADITAEYFHPWNADANGSRLTLNVGIRSRIIDHAAGELRLTFASDEALLQDWALLATTAESPGSTSVKTAVQYALGKIGATLDLSASDASVTDASAISWFPGTSAWDYVAGMCAATNLRLWCDESRVWRLDPRDEIVDRPGTVLAEFIEAADTIDRDGTWYDGVVVEYEWTDDADVRRLRRDIAGGSAASRVLTVNYATPYPGAGAAARMLDRVQKRGRVLDLTNVSTYTVYPGTEFTASPPATPAQTGVVERVVWSYPDAHMRVTSRGLVDTDPAAWLLIPEGESWLSNPVGASWLSETIGA